MKFISTITNSLILEELKSFPLQAVIYGILEGNNKGKIIEFPEGAVLIMEESDDPFVFIAGPVTSFTVDAVLSITAHTSYPMVFCHYKYHHLFLEKNWDFNLRCELMLDGPCAPLPIQDGFSIKEIETIDFFKKCISFKETSERYGSPEKFLKLGKGYALCKGSQIVSEATIYCPGGGYTEIGIVTHPEFRSQGFASQVASHLVSICLAEKYIPVWGCQIHNRASMKVALKIGFSISRYYVQMVPKVGNTLGQPLVKWLKDNPDFIP